MTKKRKKNSVNPAKHVSVWNNDEQSCTALLELYCRVVDVSKQDVDNIIDTALLLEQRYGRQPYNLQCWVDAINAYSADTGNPSMQDAVALYKYHVRKAKVKA